MVETRSGKETSPYTTEQQEKMTALVRESKERKEREKQAKLKAIADEQAAKMKRLEEEMKKVQQEEKERRKAAEAEVATEEEKERMRIESGEGSSSGTMMRETDTGLEKKISEWVANLSLGEDEEAESYVTKDEKAALAAELAAMTEPMERREREEEQNPGTGPVHLIGPRVTLQARQCMPLTRSQTKAMDRKAGESLLAYEERVAAFIQEANDRAAAAAKERSQNEQEEEAKRRKEEQDRLRQEEADLQAAAEHRSRQRERLFTRETVIGDETAHWVEMASADRAPQTDKGLFAVAQISHDLALEKQPDAVAAAGPSNLTTCVQVLEDDVSNIKRVHQDFRTSQQATNLQLETQVQAAATVTPAAASSRRPPKLDDIPVFCDQSKTEPIPWWRQFTLRLDMHHAPNNDRHPCLYHRSGGACQAWLDNILTSHGVAVSELHTKLTWQELTDAWHKRFQVEPPDLQAMDKLNKLHQNTLHSQDWISELQRLASTPDLPLAFRGVKHLFIMRSCPALQNTPTQIAETLDTSDKLFSTASRIILTNVEARNAGRSSATTSSTQPKPKVACNGATSPTSYAEAATPNEGEVLAAARDGSRGRGSRGRGSGVMAAQAKDTVQTTDKVVDNVDEAIPPGRAKLVMTPAVERLLDCMKWDANGLVVAIAQHVDTGAVLMQGFANRDAVSATLASRRATFFSWSRQCLWTKGETSANFIHVVDVFLDCDRDSVIYLGKPDGPTCHTGEETCYFIRADDIVSSGLEYAKENTLQALTSFYSLEKVIRERAAEGEAAAAAKPSAEPPAKPSWTRKLLSHPKLLCSKVREEADELCRMLEDSEGKERAASEMADLLYHSMVLLSLQGVTLEDVAQVLRSRLTNDDTHDDDYDNINNAAAASAAAAADDDDDDDDDGDDDEDEDEYDDDAPMKMLILMMMMMMMMMMICQLC
ncbi:hypothetical protein CBR_g45683 [Chara braunii]|uniref:Phosphoribosyl-AMP cyclohydrolase domain-containing protein n=1 Tax=Chara braunii TaxID=69332 RepID=A0A388K3K8_CHABU|nr:hypothetical protein CBR_g45683 [Chara braunii]|eukprot:GBG64627.1 hypothetical protein CBR_g45683 [Chara braunii]